MRDLKNNIGVVQVVAPAVLAATTTSAALDLHDFDSAAVVVNTGAIVGAGDFTTTLEESDTTTVEDFAEVDPEHLHGAFPESLEANAVVKVGYAGFKRYIRLVITKNSGTSIAASAVLVKGHAAERPVA
ncbi:hypothetical protein [Xanthobacter sediminis]